MATYTFGTVVSKSFKDAIEARFPQVFTDTNRVKFLYYILFVYPAQVKQEAAFGGEKESSSVPLYHEWVRKTLLGERDNTFSVGNFLEKFQESVDFPLNLTDFSRFENVARTFEPSVPDDVLALVLEELEIPRARKQNPVYFVDGTVATPRKDSKRRSEMHESHYKQESHSSIIIRYFSEINPISYNPYYKNIDLIIEYLKANRDSMDLTPKEYQTYIIHLNSLGESLSPRYFENNPYERVWAEGLSLQNLKREFRSSILKGCIEADLVSCHISICAYDWDITELKELLEGNVNIWKHLHTEMRIPFSPETKAGLKKGVYAIIYGGGEKRIREEMELSQELQDKFLALPLVEALRVKSQQKREEATKAKGIRLADGSWLSSRRANKGTGQRAIKPYQLVSWRAISIERYIIEAVFVVAAKYSRDFRILSLEHDGFTFVMLDKSKEASVWRKLSQAVSDRAKSIGITISLEKK